MKYFIVIFILVPTFIFSQESKLRILSEKKISDSSNFAICEIAIFNNTGYPICLKLSTTFGDRILSKDTICLVSVESSNAGFSYDLRVSMEDTEHVGYQFSGYPLVINSRGSFTATISFIRKTGSETWIDFSYVNQRDIDYCELSKNEKSLTCVDYPKIKFLTRRIKILSDGEIMSHSVK